MLKAASAHESEDKEKAEAVEARNKADNLCYQTEKVLKEHEAKISGEARERAEAAIKDVREALKDGDRAKLDRAVEQLEKASHKVAEEIYRQTAPEGKPGAEQPSEPGPRQTRPSAKPKGGEGEVIDADYKVVDDGKN
jgi:molecular chaperone DnaK